MIRLCPRDPRIGRQLSGDGLRLLKRDRLGEVDRVHAIGNLRVDGKAYFVNERLPRHLGLAVRHGGGRLEPDDQARYLAVHPIGRRCAHLTRGATRAVLGNRIHGERVFHSIAQARHRCAIHRCSYPHEPLVRSDLHDVGRRNRIIGLSPRKDHLVVAGHR